MIYTTNIFINIYISDNMSLQTSICIFDISIFKDTINDDFSYKKKKKKKLFINKKKSKKIKTKLKLVLFFLNINKFKHLKKLGAQITNK